MSPAGLAHAIRVVAAGRRYLGPEIGEALLARSRQPGQPANQRERGRSLSPRETEVLQQMATAATYREIGEHLHISEETVRTHVKRIFTKLGQPNRTQAVIAAIKVMKPKTRFIIAVSFDAGTQAGLHAPLGGG